MSIQADTPHYLETGAGQPIWLTAPKAKRYVMRQLLAMRRLLRKPLTVVAGVLLSGAAAKAGYGGWGAGLILASFPFYLSVVATAMLTHRLGSMVVDMQARYPLRSPVDHPR